LDVRLEVTLGAMIGLEDSRERGIVKVLRNCSMSDGSGGLVLGEGKALFKWPLSRRCSGPVGKCRGICVGPLLRERVSWEGSHV